MTFFFSFQYWESLREKLEKLEISGDKCVITDSGEVFNLEPQESRERSVTGSSDTPSCNGERIVSGQSSSQGSKSDGESSSDGMTESPDDSAPEENLSSTCTSAEFGEENILDKLTKGRRAPLGICEGVTDDLKSPRATPTEFSSSAATEGGHSVEVSNSEGMSVQHIENNTAQTFISDASEINLTQGYKMITDEMEIIELDEDVEEVYEGNLCNENAKEDGDGSSSPPPTPCQPSRNLTVIVEELEHCALPE